MKESFGQTNMKMPIIHALVNHNCIIEVFKCLFVNKVSTLFTKRHCASEIKMDEFILYFSLLALSLQHKKENDG